MNDDRPNAALQPSLLLGASMLPPGDSGGEMAAVNLRHVPVERLHHDPEQPRRRVRTEGPAWEALLDSIRTLGLRHILVRIVKHPRLIALAVETQVAENALREDLSPLDELDAYKRYLATTGKNQSALAASLGLARSVVCDVFKLDRIDGAVKDEIRASNRNFSRRQLLTVAGQADMDAQRRALARLVEPKDPKTRPKPERFQGDGYCCSLKLHEGGGAELRIVMRMAADRAEMAMGLRSLAEQLAPDAGAA